VNSALTPTGSHLVHDTASFTLHLVDPKTGSEIPSLLSGSTQVAQPQFAPSGGLLAFVANVDTSAPNNIHEFRRSDLDLVDVDPATAALSNRRTIQSGGGQAIAFPTFTPDSQWVVFQKGDVSRAKYGAANDQTGHDDLFMSPVTAGGSPIHLARASGAGVLAPKDLQRNYQPRAAPVAVGGYFWVVFVSPRDYGNRMASTQDSTTQNRKQLWVAAIDANPQPGVDPSHPAFWLPGQDNADINMDGYWAMEPCRQDGASCNEGYECCSGFCRDQGDGTFACLPPPPNECSQIGEACQVDEDCCDFPDARCIGGFCGLAGPK
jgi:hypothetical protein